MERARFWWRPVLALALFFSCTWAMAQDEGQAPEVDEAEVEEPVITDPRVLAEQALQAGNADECLAQWDRLTTNQRKTARNQWLRLQCLYASHEERPDNRMLAASSLVGLKEYVFNNSGSLGSKSHVDQAEKWIERLERYFNYNGLTYANMRYGDLPKEQRVVLGMVEKLMGDYIDDADYEKNIEKALQLQLDAVVDLDLPLSNGDTPFMYCLRKDALAPFKTLAARWVGASVKRNNQLLLQAVEMDAVRITSELLNRNRDPGKEPLLMQTAVEHRSQRLLQNWYKADIDVDRRIPGLDQWRELAMKNSTSLATAAFNLGDTTFLRYAVNLGVQRDTLAHLVFRSIANRDPGSLDILMSGNPPETALSSAGGSYMHEAMALDAPDLLKVLWKFGWLKTLEGTLDADGLPAVHYLVTRNLPKVLGEPNLIAHLNLNATDLQGFCILHKVIFRPEEGMSMSNTKLLKFLLESNQFMSRNQAGPYFDWTALHYAVRQNNDEMVKILVNDRADKRLKDTLGRTPTRIAKEYGFDNILSVL